MEKYEYKVDFLEATVAEKDIKKGLSGQKVATQVELKLGEYQKKGYEFYSQNVVAVQVAPGCLTMLRGGKGFTVDIMIMVFRRVVQ